MFDRSEAYRYMILENRDISQQPGATAATLMRKVDLGEVSFMSTDLDPLTQIDYNNKLRKQPSHRIRVYGPIRSVKQTQPTAGDIVPAQVGLDYLRRTHAEYRVSITKVKFPPGLAEQAAQKQTMFVRFNQFLGDGSGAIYTTQSKQLKMKGQSRGEVYFSDRRESAFYVSKLADLDRQELFSLGLEIRESQRPMSLVTERLAAHEAYDSHEPEMAARVEKYNAANGGQALRNAGT